MHFLTFLFFPPSPPFPLSFCLSFPFSLPFDPCCLCSPAVLGMIWSLSLQGCITSVLSPNTSWRSLQTFHHSTFPESASWSPYVSQITVSATISPPYCCLFEFFTIIFFTLALVRHLFCSTEQASCSLSFLTFAEKPCSSGPYCGSKIQGSRLILFVSCLCDICARDFG